MKKLLAIFILSAGMGACSVNSYAHEGFRHPGYYRGGCYGCGWVAPALIGGVIGYELSRQPVYVNPPVVYTPPPVIVQQPQTTVQAPPYGYHWQDMVDPQTGVHKIVAVPN